MNFINYLSEYFNGIALTLILTLSAIGLGLLLAVGATICSISSITWLKKIVDALIFFLTGTPFLVQIFLLYYGVSQFEWVRESAIWYVLREPMACAIIALSINSAAYTSVLFKGAIRSVPGDEAAACQALAMSKWQAFRHVIFPRAFRIAIPAYSNEVIMILKSSSLASTITLLEIMGVTQALISQTYQPIQWYIVAGIIYLFLNTIILVVFKRLKRWAIRHQQISA